MTRFLLCTIVCLLPVVLSTAECGETESDTKTRDSNPTTDATKGSAENANADDVHYYFHKEERPPAAEWNYTGETGPTHWGALSPDYHLADAGHQQSPIDIREVIHQAMPRLEFRYHPARLKLLFDGHAIEGFQEKDSFLHVGERRFELKQFHFHSPSEHTVNGRHSAMEMHLVHRAEDGTYAVVATLIEQGEHNATFDAFWGDLPAETLTEVQFSKTLNVKSLLPKTRSHYHYLGSFTTPPCTEGVDWFIMATHVELSKEQITRFRAIVHGNNRPVQPLNGRVVKLQE